MPAEEEVRARWESRGVVGANDFYQYCIDEGVCPDLPARRSTMEIRSEWYGFQGLKFPFESHRLESRLRQNGPSRQKEPGCSQTRRKGGIEPPGAIRASIQLGISRWFLPIHEPACTRGNQGATHVCLDVDQSWKAGIGPILAPRHRPRHRVRPTYQSP